jgi:hypothetical protein
MTGRTVAIIEWALAAVLVVWFVGFLVLSDTLLPDPTLGFTITSVFFAPGLAFSLVVNGLVHFFRRERLAKSEHVLLGIEGFIIVVLVLVSVVDQLSYAPYAGVGSGLGHWLDWFMPLWVVIGPIALAVMILGLVKRTSKAAPAS